MEDKQEANLSRHRAVESTCKDFEPVWTSRPGFSRIFSGYQANIKAIEVVSGSQSNPTDGIATAKAKAKVAAAQAVVGIAGQLHVYAAQTGNDQLLKEVEISETALLTPKDDEFPGRCITILNLARTHMKAAADYDITEDLVLGAEGLIGIFKDLSPKPKKARGNRKADTQQLVKLFKETDAQLEMLKKLAVPIKEASPEFYAKFLNACVVYHSPTRSAKAKPAKPASA